MSRSNPMRSRLPRLLGPLVLAVWWAGCAAPHHEAAGRGDSVSPPVIFMIGDSTMADKPLLPPQPERGWGQMLPLYFKPEIRIVNLARNGRSSKSFRDEGRWQPVLDRLRPGDYVIIQFGHNDEKAGDPARFTEPFGSFKDNLTRYVNETRERGGHPILATSIVRRKFNAQGELEDTHGDYVVATRQVAAEQKVPLLELERGTATLVQRLGPELSRNLYLWVEPGEFASLPDGRQDDTHLNACGASRVCDLATSSIKENVPALTGWLQAGK
ncbi:MAG: rhamnogalacturonan acetylesterase [Verrucomicrobia bacterium]|nr:rhamnogalacturonan acetylesterase [Verrucomicrobiota bacterium]